MPYKGLLKRPDLKHGWEVGMHHEMPDSDGLRLHKDSVHHAECPCCNTMTERFRLIDVSALPAAITGGNKWACDGCWTRWERENHTLPDGRVFDEAVMYELMGAPSGLVSEVRETVEIQKGRKRPLPDPNPHSS